MITRRTRDAVVGAAVALTLVTAACSGGSGSAKTKDQSVDPNTSEVNPAGDIPDNQVFVTFKDPSGRFTVDVPEGWSRTGSGAVTTFTDNLNTVRVETAPLAKAPTVQSATQDEVPAIAAASAAYEAGKVTEVHRKGGPAVLITYRQDGAPAPVTGRRTRLDVERYEFWKGGTEVVLTLSGPQGADNVDPWRIVTDSVAFR